jgi:tRNA(fMet)-specific endonuclease VapC
MDLIRRVARVAPENQTTTAITAGELLYGVARRGNARLEQAVRGFLDTAVTILPFDLRAAWAYGDLRTRLESEGRRLAEPDLRIASIALAHGLTLVSGNVRHFERVPGLALEDWLTPNV